MFMTYDPGDEYELSFQRDGSVFSDFAYKELFIVR
jgi:hypothetical protein